MEPVRMMLAISGRFPNVRANTIQMSIPYCLLPSCAYASQHVCVFRFNSMLQAGYTDERHSSPPSSGLESNLGRLPIVQVGSESIGQSGAQYMYVARECDLLGDNSIEAAKCMSIYEHAREMTQVWRELVPWGAEPTAEVLNKWFSEGSTDVSGPAVGAERSTRFLTWWMGRIESTLASNGFAVGNRLSLADIILYNVFAEHMSASDCPPDVKSYSKGPFGGDLAKDKLAAALAAHPKIKASCDAVAANKNIQKWLATRGTQYF